MQPDKGANMLPLPKSPIDTIRLADWVELSALLSPDLSTSSGDLRAALRTAALFERGGDEAIESKALEVFRELEQRALAADTAYPFSSEGGVLTAQANWQDFTSYLFCLCLSYFGWKNKIGAKTFPRRLFEDLACDAAKNYLRGHAVRFASPRKDLPSSFKEAVTVLCTKNIEEGEGFREQPSLRSQDDTVDVVAWSDFPDHLPGKLLMFGACASGANWENKINELQPGVFCNQWMIEPPASPLVKAFFIPHRIDKSLWMKYSRRSGIIFDRCRIAFWAPVVGSVNGTCDMECSADWAKSVLEGVRE